MSDFKKKVTAKPPSAVKHLAPVYSPDDHKRTFDMRPKPSAERRHEGPVYRPPRHDEPVLSDPLESDTPDTDQAE